MKIRKLRSVRLVLIVIAVILSLAIVGVRMLWMPSETVPEETVQETSSTNAVQPTETVPVQTQPTEIPTEEPTEVTQETEPEATQEAEPEQDPDANTEENPDDLDKPSLPFPNTNSSGGGQKEESLENNLDEVQPGAVTPDASESNELPAANESESEDTEIRLVSAEHTTQSGEEKQTTIPEAPGKADTEDKQGQNPVNGMRTAATVFYVLCVLLVADIAAIVVLSVMIHKEKNKTDDEDGGAVTVRTAPQCAQDQSPGEIRVGQLHNIGARPYQEDSSGVSMLDDGVLAVVADGMGGLSGGDRVSQKIVYTMLGYGDRLRPNALDGVLERMVHGTNETVNTMLGPEGLYKSGSTLLAVLVRKNRFHWITVGDSHIYYYHNGHLTQLNQEHNRGQELLNMAARGEITYEEARNAPKKNGLTSFIGMGRLKYIDKSTESIPLVAGDRILLMTDGVFNALSDQTMEAVLTKIPDVQQAAAELERLVIQKASPRQDNFTAVILGF